MAKRALLDSRKKASKVSAWTSLRLLTSAPPLDLNPLPTNTHQPPLWLQAIHILAKGCESPLDSKAFWGNTRVVGVPPNRLNIRDVRGRGASLQVTSHSEQRKVVLSHWRDGICVASTPVDLAELPALIAVLAGALGDAAASPSPAITIPPRPSLWHRLTDQFPPTLAKIVELPHRHGHDGDDVE